MDHALMDKSFFLFFFFVFFLNHMHLFKVQRQHAPRPLFTSRLKYLPLSANINLRVWSLFRHNTSILAFHLGFIFK